MNKNQTDPFTKSNQIDLIIGIIIGFSIFMITSLFINRDQDSLSAYGAYAGALANIFLALMTSLYLRTVNKQVNIMIEDKGRARDNEKLESLSNHMIQLVSKLYYNKENDVYFGITSRRLNRINEYDPEAIAYFRFWDQIMGSLHLASPSLSLALNKYFDAKEAYWNAREDYPYSPFDYTERGAQLRKNFDEKRSDLSLEVDRTHRTLNGEINTIKRRLESS